MKRIPLIMAVGALLLVLSAAVAVAHQVVINCDGGPCNGTNHDNDIYGTDRRDVIEAKAGEDRVWAYGSAESGKDARDVVYGQGDADKIYSGRDNDYVSGGGGNDEIRDEAGPRWGDVADVDKVYGGGGNDYIDVADGDTRDVVDCGSGTDDTVRFDRNSDTGKRDSIVNCENKIRVDSASTTSATADSETVSAQQQYGEETTETSS